MLLVPKSVPVVQYWFQHALHPSTRTGAPRLRLPLLRSTHSLAVPPASWSRYPPPIEQGSEEAKKDDDAAASAKLTHIGSLETWWSKGPEEGKTSDANVVKVVMEA